MAPSSDGQVFFLLFLIAGDVLSAAGALMAELGDGFAATHPTGSDP